MQLTERGFTGVRGGRHGQMLLAEDDDGMVVAGIDTTFTLDDCPVDLWQTIDVDKLAADTGCAVAVKHGPRYWLMDRIERAARSEFVLDEPQNTCCRYR